MVGQLAQQGVEVGPELGILRLCVRGSGVVDEVVGEFGASGCVRIAGAVKGDSLS